MHLQRRQLILGAGASAMLGACASVPDAPPAAPTWSIPPLLISPERLMRITVCTRPFRPQGPRIEVETVADKRVVHNYGHGGSGWSLAWGSAAEAATLALADAPRAVAVVGAGALGMTSATLLAQRGVAVTIYAKDLPPETRSARATGTWSPDSRIALTSEMPSGFAERWEAMARLSYAAHQAYVGLADEPVEFTERYALSNGAPSTPYEVHGFASLYPRLRGLTPPYTTLEPGTHPFPVERARRGLSMTFNVAAYAHRMLSDFLLMGGHIERREFHEPADLTQLNQPVIVNCTGYGARQLWRDETLVPVRGQIAWLAPQRDGRYGIYYGGIAVLARSDGVAIQHMGDTDSWGYNVATEDPDREEYQRALGIVAPLFQGWAG